MRSKLLLLIGIPVLFTGCNTGGMPYRLANELATALEPRSSQFERQEIAQSDPGQLASPKYARDQQQQYQQAVALTQYQEPALRESQMQAARTMPLTDNPSEHGQAGTQQGMFPFYTDASVQTLPQSATEMVLRLERQLVDLRSEIVQLRESMESLVRENDGLKMTRDQQQERLSRLENELLQSRRELSQAHARFDELNERIQQFNSHRQSQIRELNRIIDQLETQLRRTGDSMGVTPDYQRDHQQQMPATNPAPVTQPRLSTPLQKSTTINPYRKSSHQRR